MMALRWTPSFVIPTEVEKSLSIPKVTRSVPEALRDVPTSLDMTVGRWA